MANNELALQNQAAQTPTFGNSTEFEHAQRVAKALQTSDLIPKNFKDNLGNIMIALELSNRIGASPLMVMQNLYIIHGKPSWSSTFIISAINACGRFSPLRYDAGEDYCTAWAYDKKTNDKLMGVKVTMAMAKSEGWLDKSGSKWKTMPELMLRYRAATFFGRTYCPDILMGMHTEDEVEDFTALATFEQEEQIISLLQNATYDEKKVRGVKWEMNKGISIGRAMEIIADLKLNQAEPANMNQTEIKAKIGDIIGQEIPFTETESINQQS